MPGGAGLPAAGKASIDLERHAELVAPIAAMIIAKAGSEQTFIAGEEVQRIALLQSVQQELPDAFASLLAALLPDYYELACGLAGLWLDFPPAAASGPFHPHNGCCDGRAAGKGQASPQTLA